MAEEEKKEGAPAADESTESTESPEQPKKETEEERAKKKSFRLFLLMAIVNIGFLTWLIYTMRYQVEKPKAEVATEVSIDEETVPEETAAAEEDYERLGEAIAIEPFLVNVPATHKGKTRYGQKVLRVRFEVIPESEKATVLIEKKMPKLRDSVNLLLSSQDYADLSMSNGRDDLRRQVVETINEVIQPEKITKVYFTEFVIN